LALLSVADGGDKAETGKPCVKSCPANLALLSADLLINDLCTIVKSAQLFSLQTVISNDALWATNFCTSPSDISLPSQLELLGSL